MALAQIKTKMHYRFDEGVEKEAKIIGDIILKAKPRWMPKLVYSYFTRRIMALDWHYK